MSDSLTHAQALRAIYIDFEGNAGKPPSFLGILPAEGISFQQIIVEENLQPAAEARPRSIHRSPASYVNQVAVEACRRTETLERCIEGLVLLCEAEDRLLVSWSSFERQVVEQHVDGKLAARFASLHRDGKVPAKKWKRRFHRNVTFRQAPFQPRHRLDNYLGLIGYNVPSHLGEQQAAQRIAYVREQLVKRDGDYSQLTPVAKAKWTKVLDYNWHDCNGLREVVLRATREMAA